MRRFWKDKRGSSLVVMLITMTFLTLLAMTIITVTITNIRLKASQRESQKNFYKTDSVLDSVVAGIQNESSQISAGAYSEALAEYSDSLANPVDSRQEKYAATYMENMVNLLAGSKVYAAGTDQYTYEDSILLKYLKNSEQTSYIQHTDAETGIGRDGAGIMVVDGDSIVLKDLKAYKTEGSYETTIQTDVRIDVPTINAEVKSAYLNYAMLADNQIITEGGKRVTVEGDIYAGTVNRTANDTKGIVVSSGSEMNVKAENVITRGDISVSGSKLILGGTAVKDAEIWAENVITESGSVGNTVEISGKSYIADDLEVNGTNDKIKLSGYYYGYNYNDDYTNATDLATDASYSSSISINGKNDQLDLSNLLHLILSGRTFISKKTLTGEIGVSDNPDIELGESLTVRSSQLAYLVPDDYIHTIDDLTNKGYTCENLTTVPGYGNITDDAGTSTLMYYFYYPDATSADPRGTLYAFDYKGYQDYTGITNLDVLSYLEPTMPLKRYYRNYKPVGGDSRQVTYYYLNFETKDKSSEYYGKFYKDSTMQSVYDDVNKAYLDNVGIKIDDSSTQILQTSGNILYSDQTDGKLKVKIQNTDPTADNILGQYAAKKSKEYMSKQLALISDYDEAMKSSLWRLPENSAADMSKSGKKDKTNLFDKLVDRDSLVIDSGAMSTSEGNGAYYISTNDVTWSGRDSAGNACDGGIIITSGDVTLDADFTGMIIAGGDIKIGATGITVKSGEKLVTEMFTQDKASASPKFYNLLSKYFRKSVDATVGSGDTTNVENVSYENWKKN